MKLQEKISLLTRIKQRDHCDNLPCEGCFFNGKHDKYIKDSMGELTNEEIYYKLYIAAIVESLKNNLITIDELFEELL